MAHDDAVFHGEVRHNHVRAYNGIVLANSFRTGQHWSSAFVNIEHNAHYTPVCYVNEPVD